MRPEIPSALVERVEHIYESEGYASRGEFIRDAIRRRVEEVEGESNVDFAEPIVTLNEEGGVKYGTDIRSGNPIILNRFNRPTGGNVLTSGHIGTGKTVTTQAVLMRELRERDDIHVVIIDPLQAFTGLAYASGGQRVSVGGGIGINPLEITPVPKKMVEEVPSLDPYTTNIKDVMGFFEAYFVSTEREVSSDDFALLERAVHETYTNHGITRDPHTHHLESPTMPDLLDVISQMAQYPTQYAHSDSETEIETIERSAAELLISLNSLSEGGEYEHFGRQTEISLFDGEHQLTHLDLHSNVSDTSLIYRQLFSLVVDRAKQVEGEVVLVMDEGRYLFNTPSTDTIETGFRHSRHYDLSINLIVQSLTDLENKELLEPVSNSCSIVQLHREPDLSAATAKKMGLSTGEADFVRNAEPGVSDSDFSEHLLRVDSEWRPVQFELDNDEQLVIDFDPRNSVSGLMDNIDI